MGVPTHLEKQKLERALSMSSGYVLEFTNRTFEEFFREVVGVEIYGLRYDNGSSKANRMRAFWNVATDQEFLKFLDGILEGWELYSTTPIPEVTAKLLKDIAARIRARQHPTSSPPALSRRFEDLRFLVALSFPGTKREYVRQVSDRLKQSLQANELFYDEDFQAHLARPDLDKLLLNIYRERSSLVVVFLSADYDKSEWCGLEWRAVRDMIKSKSGDQLMFIRFDQTAIDGALSIDGYIDAAKHAPTQTATFILQRVQDAPPKGTKVDRIQTEDM